MFINHSSATKYRKQIINATVKEKANIYFLETVIKYFPTNTLTSLKVLLGKSGFQSFTFLFH